MCNLHLVYTSDGYNRLSTINRCIKSLDFMGTGEKEKEEKGKNKRQSEYNFIAGNEGMVFCVSYVCAT